MKVKLLKNKILKNISYLFKLEKNLAEPTIQQIESTNSCMMDCIMCPRRHMTRKIGFMDLGLFKKIIDQAKWNEEIWLHHFGDPLLHPKIIEMINYVKLKGIKPKMSINPNLLGKEMSNRILDSGIDTIMISLDGTDQSSYQYFRGKNADYRGALTNINNFLDLKIKKRSNVHIILSMIRMKRNLDQVEKFRKIWMKKGVSEVSIKKFITWDGSDSKIANLGESNVSKNKKPYCTEPWFKVTVTWDGLVVPCCYDYDNKYVLGDLKTQPLIEIWNDKKIVSLRKQIKEKNLVNPLCVNCRDQLNTSITRYDLSKLKFKHFIILFKKIKFYFQTFPR